jgi:hypothetical protein
MGFADWEMVRQWLMSSPDRRNPGRPAGGDAGAVGIVSSGVVRFTNCAFYDNYVQWGSGGASELLKLLVILLSYDRVLDTGDEAGFETGGVSQALVFAKWAVGQQSLALG